MLFLCWEILKAAGSLGLFLYGMQKISAGLEKIAARRLAIWVAQITESPLSGFLTGAIATAILQSSSMVTITVIGLANARSITLKQGINVIIGANVGTTITAQLISYNPAEAAFPLIGSGFILFMLLPGHRFKAAGEAMMGFGFLLLGLNSLIETLSPLTRSPLVISILTEALSPLEGIALGSILTAIVQSSSAVIGMVISLASSSYITLYSAVAIMMGADLGTCITSLLASWKGNRTARRAAVAHFFFNLGTIMIILPFFSSFLLLIELVSTAQLPRQIANSHTLYNIIGALILLPLSGIISSILEIIIKE